MTDDEPQQVYLAPGDAAARLGVSPSGLRRLAGVYAGVHGELPKDASGTSRMWPSDAVMRLNQARLMLAAGQARTIKDALQALEYGDKPPADAAVALGRDGRVVEALELVVGELRNASELNSALRVELAELRGQLAEIRAERQHAALPSAEATPAQVPAAVTGVTAGDAGPGLLVRAATWLEGLLRR